MNDLLTACACNTPMQRGKSGYLICPNCDVPQDVERQMIDGRPGKRRITPEDRWFNLAWEVRKRNIYGN